MSLTAELMEEWYAFSFAATGRRLAPNHIAIEGEEGTLSYEVPDGSPPLKLRNGSPTRIVTLVYDIEEIQNEPRH